MGEVDTKQYITIKLIEEKFGIEIKYIHNIIVMQGITRVPKSQSFFKGVINLRGEIIPVMNLRIKFGMEEGELGKLARIIILKPDPQAAPVGIIVDEVKEVITLSDSEIEKINYEENDLIDNYNIGIGKVGDDLINLLNIPAIIIEKEAAKQ